MPNPKRLYAGHFAKKAGEGKLEIIGTCWKTNERYAVVVVEDDLKSWLRGEKFIQEAFPYLSPGDREFLKSGLSPRGYKMVFPKDEYPEGFNKEQIRVLMATGDMGYTYDPESGKVRREK